MLAFKIIIGVTAVIIMVAVIYFLNKWDNKRK